MHRAQIIESSLSIEDQSMAMLACELHDGPCQHLIAAFCHLDAFRRLQANDPEGAAKEFYHGFTALRRGMDALRNLVSDIRPFQIHGSTLLKDIEELIADNAFSYGLLVMFSHTPPEIDLPPLVRTAVLRIIQEGLANVRRHSRCKAARLDVVQRDGWIRMEIEDWGVGFDPAAIGRNCFGLAGIRARAALLGGDMRLSSTPGQGTLVVVEIPIVSIEDAAAATSPWQDEHPGRD